MITNLTNRLKTSLASTLKRSIVVGRKNRRSKFDKTNYIEDWVPRQRKYHKNRKPRLKEWEDENEIWPPIYPKSYHGSGAHLLQQLEMEEHQRMTQLKSFNYPDFRSGDVIRFHYLHSLSEGNGNTVTGLCIGVNSRKKNGKFRVLFNLAGVAVHMVLPMNSPMITHFEIVQRGTGNIRNNLRRFYDKHLSSIPLGPLKKGRKYYRREGDVVHEQKQKKVSVTYDDIYDPLLD